MYGKLTAVTLFKKHSELIPLVGFLSFAGAMGLAFSAYSLYQKPDVTVVKSRKEAPWERVETEKAQKLVTLNMRYRKIPELEELRKDMGYYKP